MKNKFLLLFAVVVGASTTTMLPVSARAQETPPRSVSGAADVHSSADRGRTRAFTNLNAMHASYEVDFATRPGFGFSRVMYLPPQDFITYNGETYRFATPDLLGLEDEPIAFRKTGGIDGFSMALMSKKELRKFLQRRPLTLSESNALVELRAGRDLVVTPSLVVGDAAHGNNVVGGLAVVGALRAKAQCAECHQVREGTLLGAFSYTLVPANPAKRTEPSLTSINLRGIQFGSVPPSRENSLTPAPGKLEIKSDPAPSAGMLFSIKPREAGSKSRLPLLTNTLDLLISDAPAPRFLTGAQAN